jgi:hypothetical protein
MLKTIQKYSNFRRLHVLIFKVRVRVSYWIKNIDIKHYINEMTYKVLC